MLQSQKVSILLLRLTLGWLFFWAGITKVLNPDFSAAGYLGSAKTFSGFYDWLASPAVLPFTNFINEWGLTLIGVSLLIGVAMRYSAPLGALMMVLYYFPILDGLRPNSHAFIVDEHLIYAAGLLVIAQYGSSSAWCLGGYLGRLPILSRFAKKL